MGGIKAHPLVKKTAERLTIVKSQERGEVGYSHIGAGEQERGFFDAEVLDVLVGRQVIGRTKQS